MSIQTKYFLIAIVFAGSSGIWLPLIIEGLVKGTCTYHSIPQNVITYFVSLVFAGCIDLFLSKLKEISIDGLLNHFLNILMLLVLSIGLILSAVILNVKYQDNWAMLIGVIGILISYYIWWKSNTENPNFSTGNGTLGGNPKKEIKNG
jgi:hypothetical protein